MEETQTKEKRRRSTNPATTWKEVMELAGMIQGLKAKERAIVRDVIAGMASRTTRRQPPAQQ